MKNSMLDYKSCFKVHKTVNLLKKMCISVKSRKSKALKAKKYVQEDIITEIATLYRK